MSPLSTMPGTGSDEMACGGSNATAAARSCNNTCSCAAAARASESRLRLWLRTVLRRCRRCTDKADAAGSALPCSSSQRTAPPSSNQVQVRGICYYTSRATLCTVISAETGANARASLQLLHLLNAQINWCSPHVSTHNARADRYRFMVKFVMLSLTVMANALRTR
eukprot:9925-Heterococcus_DN1.PRE.1